MIQSYMALQEVKVLECKHITMICVFTTSFRGIIEWNLIRYNSYKHKQNISDLELKKQLIWPKAVNFSSLGRWFILSSKHNASKLFFSCLFHYLYQLIHHNWKIVRKIQNVRLSKIVWKKPAKYQIPVIENSKKKRINIENKNNWILNPYF